MKISNDTILTSRTKIYSFLLLVLTLMFFTTACSNDKTKAPVVAEKESVLQNSAESIEDPSFTPSPTQSVDNTVAEVFSWINEVGNTLDTRIKVPEGFIRIPSASSELTGFIRNLPLKAAGSEVQLYDGQPKGDQSEHIAIFDLSLGDKDLQQCADSVIRIYAEYYYSIGAYDKISFHLTNGFLMEYTKWRDGNRLVVDGNDVRWNESEAYDDSYEAFQNYLTSVFIYAGTLSLSSESEEITFDQMLPGDMFLEGGSPGHCVLVVDIAEDEAGNRSYLLAQGYMPAQDFHVLKNPLHPEDPWYYSYEMNYPLETPLWTFDENSLVRWDSFLLEEAKDISAPAMSDNADAEIESDASTITLLAAGDNLIHSQVVNSGKQADGTYNYDHLYSNVKDMISAADIAVINQETILGGEAFPYSGYPNFNSPTEIGEAVINAGFDIVLHATNHTMDMGVVGIERTIAFWKQNPQITVLGIHETEEDRTQIQIVEKNGIKIAMLNYTYSLNGYSLPEDQLYLVEILDKKKMEEDIRKAEEQADFTIVFPHWGTEYKYEASKTQKELTEFYYELGVDLIIGTHPHVIEPVEWIKTDIGHRMLVYYSLGNFMSYQKEAPRMLGGLANVTITKDDSGTYISDASITPIVTHYENGPDDYNYTIYPLNDYTEDLATRHGVSKIAQNGSLTYQDTFDLANEVLGDWFR